MNSGCVDSDDEFILPLFDDDGIPGVFAASFTLLPCFSIRAFAFAANLPCTLMSLAFAAIFFAFFICRLTERKKFLFPHFVILYIYVLNYSVN